ncbi:MAG: IPT/TIG domain-containing protein [Verrucomicrobiota bacterium]
MHTNRISPARKILVWLAALGCLMLFAGCENVTLTNLTPPSVPENPSQIYTFQLRVTSRTNMVSGIAPRLIVDGKSFPMKSAALGEGIYDYEYQVTGGRDQLNYYFLVNYNVEGNNVVTPAESYTAVQTVKIVRRYVLSLEVNRGPVGAHVSIVGRGFTAQDVVSFNGTPVRTQLESPNAVSFTVPALEANRNYSVTINSAAGSSPVGTFRIDPSTVDISPSSLNLRTGERTNLTFTLPNPALPGGTLLDVATDVPDSIIMPEVVIPQGQTSITITVEGGKPGNGSLYLKGYGSGEVTVPVTVTPR